MAKLGWVLLSVAVFYLVAVAAVAVFQHRLLYLPERIAAGTALPVGLKHWPNRSDFRGYVAEPRGAVRATVLVLHGNAGHAVHRAHYAATLVPLGLRVVLAEYPGYGERRGLVGEPSLVPDAEQAIALAHGLHGAPVLVLGESLGAGVAARAAAAQSERVAGLLLVTPWSRLADVASHHYPWLPVRWLLRDRYDSAAHLEDFARPVLTVVAEHDAVIPAAHGLALHEGLRGAKRLALLAGSGHTDWPERLDARWWQEAIDFLLSTPEIS